MASHATVDDYINSHPTDIQPILRQIRATIHQALPGSDEAMRYQMPVVLLHGRYILYFAAWKHHIGLYPIPVFEGSLEADVAPYRAAKDSVRLPFRKPIPYDLVRRIAQAIATQGKSPSTK